LQRSLLLAFVLAAAAVPGAAQRQRKPKIKPSVSYAVTWEGAVAEARLLKLPIVVHDHGFY
jgi:hypothetical protein